MGKIIKNVQDVSHPGRPADFLLAAWLTDGWQFGEVCLVQRLVAVAF